jgi:putative transcriptional regulator
MAGWCMEGAVDASRATSRWTGDVIRRFRQARGLTQEELAHELGVTSSSVNRWENGHCGPTKLARRRLDELSSGVADGRTGS